MPGSRQLPLLRCTRCNSLLKTRHVRCPLRRQHPAQPDYLYSLKMLPPKKLLLNISFYFSFLKTLYSFNNSLHLVCFYPGNICQPQVPVYQEALQGFIRFLPAALAPEGFNHSKLRGRCPLFTAVRQLLVFHFPFTLAELLVSRSEEHT